MHTTIYYFTGTGNSLMVARDLARELGETTLVSIADVVNDPVNVTADCVGIVFPVYLFGLPFIVTKFMKKLQARDLKYIFALATYRSLAGNALGLLEKQLKAKGLQLGAGFNIRMPGNYLAVYQKDRLPLQQKKFETWAKKAKEVAEIVAKQKQVEVERGSMLQCILGTGLLNKMLSKSLQTADKRFWSDSNCVGCSVCQRVCPVQNIRLENGKPVWLHQCEQCFACFNWCPRQAIQMGKSTLGRERYQNPKVKLGDLERKSRL